MEPQKWEISWLTGSATYIHNPSHNNATERRFVWHGNWVVQELRTVKTAMQGGLTQHYVPIPWNLQTLFLLESGSAVSPKGPRSGHGPQDGEELVKSKEVEPSGRSLGHWGLLASSHLPSASQDVRALVLHQVLLPLQAASPQAQSNQAKPTVDRNLQELCVQLSLF